MKKTILFVVTNGIGLGHLTRGLAIARQIRKLDKEAECLFLSTSLATEVFRKENFMFYYIPTRGIMPKKVTPSIWNNYMKAQLGYIINFHQVDMLVFDGGYPYGGILGTLQENKSLKSMWIKREGYKEELSSLIRYEELFNEVVVPIEAGEDYDDIRSKLYCNPIIMINEEEAYPRESLRKIWQVLPGEQVIYIQLGAGAINDIEPIMNTVITCALENSNNRIIVGESIIGRSLHRGGNRVSVIKEYPNSLYFKGIDFAISAAGYNTFHELLGFKVPTLFIPNEQTKRDDQTKRALLAQKIGMGRCLEEITEVKIKENLEYLYAHKTNMIQNGKDLPPFNGAKQVAKKILNRIE